MPHGQERLLLGLLSQAFDTGRTFHQVSPFRRKGQRHCL
jgi:hypothetical protein